MPIPQCMRNACFPNQAVFSSPYLRPISKTLMVKLGDITKYFRLLLSNYVIKTCSFQKVIWHQQYASACACLCFGFGDFSGKNNWKKIIDFEIVLRELASGSGSVMIIGLLVNTGAKYVALIYDLYTYSYWA